MEVIAPYRPFLNGGEKVNDPIHGNQMKTLTSADFEGNFYHPRILGDFL